MYILWLNHKLTLKDNTIYTVLLCLCVADPATFLASNTVLGTLFSSEKSFFYSLLKKSLYYYLIYIVSIKILSLNLNKNV